MLEIVPNKINLNLVPIRSTQNVEEKTMKPKETVELEATIEPVSVLLESVPVSDEYMILNVSQKPLISCHFNL